MFEYDGVRITSIQAVSDEQTAEWMRRVYLRLPAFMSHGRNPHSAYECLSKISNETDIALHYCWRILRRLVQFGAVHHVGPGRYRKVEWCPYIDDPEIRNIDKRWRRDQRSNAATCNA